MGKQLINTGIIDLMRSVGAMSAIDGNMQNDIFG